MRKFLVIGVSVLILISYSFGELVKIDLNSAFSNFSPEDPEYSLNYGTIILEDGYFVEGDGNDVKVTVKINTAVAGQNADLHLLYLNSIYYGNLSIADENNVIKNIKYDYDNNKADGDGYYDILIDFGSGANPTIQEAVFYFYASTSEDVSVANFANIADPKFTYCYDGKKGYFTAAVHIQSTSTPSGSEFVGGNPVAVATPEPSILSLLCLSGLLFAFVRRR